MIKIAVTKFDDKRFLVLKILSRKRFEISTIGIYPTLKKAMEYKRLIDFILVHADIQLDKIQKELQGGTNA